MRIEELVEDYFETFMESYELDPEGSINDMLFELFVAGFEAAIDITEEEEATEESEE
jgi:hypothetical protein